MPPGVVPTGAKVGIDATISEGIPHERYERISYAYADRAKIADYLQGKSDAAGLAGDAQVAEAEAGIVQQLTQAPMYYQKLAETLFASASTSSRVRWASARDAAAVADRRRPAVHARFQVRCQAARQTLSC